MTSKAPTYEALVWQACEFYSLCQYFSTHMCRNFGNFVVEATKILTAGIPSVFFNMEAMVFFSSSTIPNKDPSSPIWGTNLGGRFGKNICIGNSFSPVVMASSTLNPCFHGEKKARDPFKSRPIVLLLSQYFPFPRDKIPCPETVC